MKNPFIRFTIRLLIIIMIVFGLHLLALSFFELPLYSNKIVLSYILNTALAIIIFGILYLMRKKYANQLGFLFLIGSFLKFATFFVFFYKPYMQDGDIVKLEFAAFFVPYFICLIVETSSLAKWLNKL